MGAEVSTVGPPTIDPAHYREVMGHYPTGVTVVTGLSADAAPVGMVVGTFTSVSLDPPLVAFMPTTASGTYALLRDSPALCINVLAHDQLDLCRLMAVPRPGKFGEVEWVMSEHGAPMLSGAVAYVHCRTHEVIPAGDHYIVLCEVQAMEVTRPATPLLFFQGGYGGFSPKGMAAKGDAEVITAVRLAELARPQAEKVARALRCEASVLVRVNDAELTTAVSAFGGAAEMREPLGERVPLMPPLGEAYIAWCPDDVIDAWLARAAQPAPEVVEKYRRRLAAVRQNGYALSRTRSDSAPQYAELHSAMREYAAGELSPARERAVRAVIASASQFFETAVVDENETYDVGAIVVPILGRDGRAALCLRASQLEQATPGRQVLEWITTLKAAAAAAQNAMAGHTEQVTAYFDAFPGDFMM